MAIKYYYVFHCKTLQNLPKLGFLVWNYAIWQPWYVEVRSSGLSSSSVCRTGLRLMASTFVSSPISHPMSTSTEAQQAYSTVGPFSWPSDFIFDSVHKKWKHSTKASVTTVQRFAVHSGIFIEDCIKWPSQKICISVFFSPREGQNYDRKKPALRMLEEWRHLGFFPLNNVDRK
jgi:hypothetical protein